MLGVPQGGIEEKVRKVLPGYMAMGEHGMGNMMEMGRPKNTLPMMAGTGPFGPVEMGGMFTVLKVRDDLAAGDYREPARYVNPPDTLARKVSSDPDFGAPVRHPPGVQPAPTRMPEMHDPMPDMPGMSQDHHSG